MFSKMKIGHFAQYNNISVQTLRYYEQIDLLHPAYIRWSNTSAKAIRCTTP